MPKSSAAVKRPRQSHPRKKARIREEEQLYLVRKGANGTTNGFRHHRPKDKRVDSEVAEAFDPATSTTDFSDNQRGAITKLLKANEYYRTHPWPAPFDKTNH